MDSVRVSGNQEVKAGDLIAYASHPSYNKTPHVNVATVTEVYEGPRGRTRLRVLVTQSSFEPWDPPLPAKRTIGTLHRVVKLATSE